MRITLKRMAVAAAAALALLAGCRQGGARRGGEREATASVEPAPGLVTEGQIPGQAGNDGAGAGNDGAGAGNDGAGALRPEGFAPGERVSEEALEALGADVFFRVDTLGDEVFARMEGVSWKPGCPVSRGELRYLRVLHRDAEGVAYVGEMVVNESIAQDVLEILRALFEAGYPIEKMRLVDDYGGDDAVSMAADNSSAFNYRPKAHNAAELSLHASGRAVDINPLYNPYVRVRANGTVLVEPPEAAPYADRTRPSPYRIERGDLCHRLFLEHGFRWGGGWASGPDYQHFEK